LSLPAENHVSPSSSFKCFTGVDIAAKDFTAATLLPGGKPKLEKKPFEQTAEGFSHFLARLAAAASGISPQEHLVVMESTGPYWVALAVYLTQKGYAVSVVNPAQVHFFAKAQLKRSKNDKLDAHTLAEFAQTMQPKLWIPPPQFYHELRQRISQRDSLLKLKNQVENQLHALIVNPIIIESVRDQLKELSATLSAQIEQMDQELAKLLKVELKELSQEIEADLSQEKAWKKSIALLRTIPGIGPLTACWLVLSTLNFTTCQSPEGLVLYAGLAPIERSSGSSIRGHPQIGHSGNGRLRTLLYMATLTAARYNPMIKVFWQRLRVEKHKPVKVARCACARKLLHLAFSIVKSGKPFDPGQNVIEGKAA
jgi:transposase